MKTRIKSPIEVLREEIENVDAHNRKVVERGHGLTEDVILFPLDIARRILEALEKQ